MGSNKKILLNQQNIFLSVLRIYREIFNRAWTRIPEILAQRANH